MRTIMMQLAFAFVFLAWPLVHAALANKNNDFEKFFRLVKRSANQLKHMQVLMECADPAKHQNEEGHAEICQLISKMQPMFNSLIEAQKMEPDEPETSLSVLKSIDEMNTLVTEFFHEYQRNVNKMMEEKLPEQKAKIDAKIAEVVAVEKEGNDGAKLAAKNLRGLLHWEIDEMKRLVAAPRWNALGQRITQRYKNIYNSTSKFMMSKFIRRGHQQKQIESGETAKETENGADDGNVHKQDDGQQHQPVGEEQHQLQKELTDEHMLLALTYECMMIVTELEQLGGRNGGGSGDGSDSVKCPNGESIALLVAEQRLSMAMLKFSVSTVNAVGEFQEQLIDAILAFSLVFIPTVLSVCIGAMGFASKFFLA